MNDKDVKALQESLQIGLTVQVMDEGFVKLWTPWFVDRNAEEFTFFAYRRPNDKKLYLTDAGLITRTLKKSGLEVNMAAVQALLRSYKLTLQQDGCVVEQTKRSLKERAGALFQAWAAADGVMRTWTLPKGKA